MLRYSASTTVHPTTSAANRSSVAHVLISSPMGIEYQEKLRNNNNQHHFILGTKAHKIKQTT